MFSSVRCNITLYTYILRSRSWVTDVRLWCVGSAVRVYVGFRSEGYFTTATTLSDHIVCLSGDVAFARTELYRDSVVVYTIYMLCTYCIVILLCNVCACVLHEIYTYILYHSINICVCVCV